MALPSIVYFGMSHVIRLREPWERQSLDDGTIRFTRRFHRPTGLNANSRVWLVVGDFHGDAEVSLNDRLLGPTDCSKAAAMVGTAHPTEFEITEMLRPENVVSILVGPVTKEQEPPDGFGLVRLEIEESQPHG
jgi:hypothetical protein